MYDNVTGLVDAYNNLTAGKKLMFSFLSDLRKLPDESPRFRLEIVQEIKKIVDNEIERLNKEIYEEV